MTPNQWRWTIGGSLRCDHWRRALPCKIATSYVISHLFCSILSLADTGIEFRVELAPDRPYVAAFFMRSHLGSFCQIFGSCNRHGIVRGVKEQERKGFCESPIGGTIGCCGNERVGCC